jgi:hypothetical protein
MKRWRCGGGNVDVRATRDFFRCHSECQNSEQRRAAVSLCRTHCTLKCREEERAVEKDDGKQGERETRQQRISSAIETQQVIASQGRGT